MTEQQLQDLLSAFTDALIHDKDEADALLDRSVMPRDAAPLLTLTRRLHTTIQPVEPSAAFQRRLKADLIGQEKKNLLWQWRKLPARVHIAAILALFGGGFSLLIVGRVADVILRRQQDKETATSS